MQYLNYNILVKLFHKYTSKIYKFCHIGTKEFCRVIHLLGKSLFLLYEVAPGYSSVQHGTKFSMECEGIRLEESSGLLQTSVNA